MTALNELEPVTLDFFDTAPLRVQCTMVAKCSPEVLFETLRGDTVWTEWAGVIQAVEWTSDKPIAKNSTRDVKLVGDMLVKEIFFHWEENERVAFYVTESTIPNLTKFAEDYIVERVGPNETRLIWTGVNPIPSQNPSTASTSPSAWACSRPGRPSAST